MSRVLVLITGTGRSGTSTMSGALHHLGLHVPGPYLGANSSNPKGFFESKWAIDFHKRLTRQAGVDDFDSRPVALEQVRAVVTSETRAELTAFVREQSAGHDQVVVKDPRSVWVQGLWKDAAAEAGLGIRYVSMLRHPAEVVGSRSAYYAKQADEQRRRAYEIISVARWVNSQLVNERETRGEPRAFVGYTELLEDWRTALARVADDLGLDYDADLTSGDHHPVDDFIDPGLRRLKVTWADLDIPVELQELAEDVWENLLVLRSGHGESAQASGRLETLSVAYQRLLDQSAAMSHDIRGAERAAARQEGARAVRERMREGANGGRALQDRVVRDVSGRELLREAGRRAVGRLRKS